jgi:hypothetical protein
LPFPFDIDLEMVFHVGVPSGRDVFDQLFRVLHLDGFDSGIAQPTAPVCTFPHAENIG